jgi:hypothetical protein
MPDKNAPTSPRDSECTVLSGEKFSQEEKMIPQIKSQLIAMNLALFGMFIFSSLSIES